MELKMCKQDGTAVDPQVVAAPTNNICHSMWEKVDVQVGDKLLNHSPDVYSLRSYLQTIMNFNIESQAEKCFTSGFIRDTTGHYDSFNLAYNVGLNARRNLFYHHGADPAHSNYVIRPYTFTTLLYHDLCQNDRPILWGVPIKITLTKAPEKFYMMVREADVEGGDFQLEITKIELQVAIGILSEKLINHIDRSLTEKKPAYYYYRRFQLAKKPIA
jgi:hypothetical protein